MEFVSNLIHANVKVGGLLYQQASTFISARSQYFPPTPSLTEKDIQPQVGKVFVITGGNQGVGLELIKMLYPTGAKIYMASRSEEKAKQAIEMVVASDPYLASRLQFLHLNLDDFVSIRKAAATFLEQESRLDILWNNAGVAALPLGSKTKQGIESHIGVNVVGSLLFTQLLHPKLKVAASSSPKDSVRVIWTSSILAESRSPPGGCVVETLEAGGSKDPYTDYGASKAGNWMIATEAGKRWEKDGILSCVQNPGNLQTHIYDSQPGLMMFFVNFLLYEPKYGAYTELFAGFSGDVKQGDYIIPWGRVQERNPRADIYKAMEEGKGGELWEWCEKQIKEHS